MREEIRRGGPIPVERYMALCLFDPDFGYYTTREPFGVAGDFTTAPEVSQMFGEMLGAWWIAAKRVMALPGMDLVEIGPGRGTLMQDMLRTIAKLDADTPPTAHMVEASGRLTIVQQDKLLGRNAHVFWHAGPETLPEVPLGIVANELFDAIPAAQYVKTCEGWFERTVCLGHHGRLEFGRSGNMIDVSLLPADHAAQPAGQIFETAPARLAMLQSLALRIKRQSGFALFFDYGHVQPGFGDTLQSVKGQNYAGVFDHPGEADLTSHVDFASLAETARKEGLFVFDIMNQGDFLRACGIEARARTLNSSGPAAGMVDSALHRLASDGQMGRLFKVLCVASAPIELAPLKIQH